MTDARGRKWGFEPGGLRLGQFRLDIQPPAATDRDRAQLATRSDIQRFRHMIPGDADFNRLKADLRRQREEDIKRPASHAHGCYLAIRAALEQVVALHHEPRRSQ